MQKAEPTPAHIIIDDLAEKLGREGRNVSLVTENIDNYHQKMQHARKINRETYKYPILPMHGSILEIRCCHCAGEVEKQWIEPYEIFAEILKMQCRLYCRYCEGPLIPNIMFHDEFYSEIYNHSETILGLAKEADVVVIVGSVGTSSLTKEVISIALEKKSSVI
jgi:NAD-dependent SIR2 family protein deacetylase